VVEREGEVRQLAALADESHRFVGLEARQVGRGGGLRGVGAPESRERYEVEEGRQAREGACIYGAGERQWENGRVRVECGGGTGG
jgi:hypothetical protein